MFSVPLWLLLLGIHLTTEAQRTHRLHREIQSKTPPLFVLYVPFVPYVAQCEYVTHLETPTDSGTGSGAVMLPMPARRERRFAPENGRVAIKCARRKLPLSNRQYVAARQQRFHPGTNPK